MTDDVWGKHTVEFFFKGNGSQFEGKVKQSFKSDVYKVERIGSSLSVYELEKPLTGFGEYLFTEILRRQTDGLAKVKKVRPSFVFSLSRIEKGLEITGECIDSDKVSEFEAFVKNFQTLISEQSEPKKEEPVKKRNQKPGKQGFLMRKTVHLYGIYVNLYLYRLT